MKTLSIKEEPFDFSFEFDNYENRLLESDPELEPDFDEFGAAFAAFEEEEEIRLRPRGAGLVSRGRPPLRHPRPPRTIIRPWRVSAGVIYEPSMCTCPEQTCSQHGSEYIRWVQSTLNQILGLRLLVNGILTPETRSALRSFQSREGLPVAGIVGPETERALVAHLPLPKRQAMRARRGFERELLDLGLATASAQEDVSPNSTWARAESEVSQPREFVPVEEMERRYPLKGASAALSKFRSLVYEAQVKMDLRAKKKFIENLPDSPKGPLPTVENVKIHWSAAKPLQELLHAARLEIGRQGKQIKVKAGNGYRSTNWQLATWATARFPQYYKQAITETTNKKTGKKKPPLIAPGDFSRSAAEKLAQYISGRFAAPGFSNHQHGLAVDFLTTERFGGKLQELGASFEQIDLWCKSWFWTWLEKEKNAYKFGFVPLKKEPWHWEYRPARAQKILGGNQGIVTTRKSDAGTALSGGKLFTFIPTTLAVKTAVFVPKAALNTNEVEVLCFAHGLNACQPQQKNPPASYVTDMPFKLGEIVNAANRPLVLVVPSLDWENLSKNTMGFGYNAKRHLLGKPKNLNRVIAEALYQVGKELGRSAPSLRRLILAGHSRAYDFLDPLAQAHADPEMSTGPLAKLEHVWAFDTTYSSSPPVHDWTNWIQSKPSLHVAVFYRVVDDRVVNGRTVKGTKEGGKKFENEIPKNRRQLVVKVVSEDHCAVPVKQLPALLAALP